MLSNLFVARCPPSCASARGRGKGALRLADRQDSPSPPPATAAAAAPAHIYTHNVPTLRTYTAHTLAQLAFELRTHEQAPLLSHGGIRQNPLRGECASSAAQLNSTSLGGNFNFN
jgi:hypothetical protein